jgi:hypothetical protein
MDSLKLEHVVASIDITSIKHDKFVSSLSVGWVKTMI